MVDWNAPASEASDRRLLYEIALGLLVAIPPAIQLIGNRTISWMWFGIGVLAIVLGYGFSRSSLGNRIDEKGSQLGVASRAVVIIVAALVVWGSVWLFTPPIVPASSFLVGSLITVVVGPTLRLLRRFSDRRQQQPA
jgi:bacteriorhodopsin